MDVDCESQQDPKIMRMVELREMLVTLAENKKALEARIKDLEGIILGLEAELTSMSARCKQLAQEVRSPP
jgi:prefoldin subunit 5